jgi:hypothetical protein
MDADKPKLSINLPQHQREQGRALYAVDFDMARARQAADKNRGIAEDDALNKIQPGPSEKAKAVWRGEGGSTADDKPLPTIFPERSGSGNSWGTERS